MGKKGKNQKKRPSNSKKIKLHNDHVDVNDMDDEIDAFHKKSDMIPLDINDDVDSDGDDDVQPVFDYKGIDGDGDEDEDEDEDDEDEHDDSYPKGLAAKIARQQKFLREKFGGIEDEMDDDAEEDEKKKTVWSKGKRDYYGAENKDYELQSSDEDTPAEEEEEVIKLQKERAKYLKPEDFGLEEDDTDEEPTLEEIMVKGKTASKSSLNKEVEGDATLTYEEVKKDLNALSKDERMALVESSAPELVGLQTELCEAIDELNRIHPLLDKVRNGGSDKKQGKHNLQVKQELLLTYCMAITFYLLLKAEGQPVHNHPVIDCLVDLKSIVDEAKAIDDDLPDELEDALNVITDSAHDMEPAADGVTSVSRPESQLNDPAGHSSEEHELRETVKPVKKQSTKVAKKQHRVERQDKPINPDSAKMLQYRAALEEKLKRKAVLDVDHTKSDKRKKQKLKALTGNLETVDDFDDDVMAGDGTVHENGRPSTLSSKVAKFTTGKGNLRKFLKGVSGDEDLPLRDDIGEKRWKHELRVLAGAGVKSMDDDAQHEDKPENSGSDEDDDKGNSETDGSEDEFYKLIKCQRAAKHAMKAEKYSRNQVLPEPETASDGKRHITTQMEKNRGLTRPRTKLLKNPRKKLRIKHKKAVNARKGQVRDIRKPSGPYGGETTGINAHVSRSIRIK